MKIQDGQLQNPECMQDKEGWLSWARILQHWGMKEPVATIIEAAGPLAVFIAQFIYFGQPFLRSVVPSGQWMLLADTLEDRKERQMFVSYLRSEENV